MVNVNLEDTTEMCLVEYQDMIEHFLTHTPHPSFSKGVGIGSLKRRLDDTDLLRLENRIKSFGQFAVIVMNQAAKCLNPFFDGPEYVFRKSDSTTKKSQHKSCSL